jgi:hypothetical protein
LTAPKPFDRSSVPLTHRLPPALPDQLHGLAPGADTDLTFV